MRHDYTHLDAAILHRIAVARCVMAWQLDVLDVRDHAKTICDAINAGRPKWGHTHTGHVIDRRLQALRKAGRIAYQRKPAGWVLASPTTPKD